MDQNPIIPEKEENVETGQYAVKRSLRTDVIAAVICFLLAFLVWFVVMHLQDTDYLAVDTAGLPEGYTISVTELEVKGTVAALRNAGKIEIQGIPAGLAAGTYTLYDSVFVLPEGLELGDAPTVTLTVQYK